jgi:hypothetical protein
LTHEQADPDGTELPRPTTSGRRAVVLVAADDAVVAGSRLLLLVASDVVDVDVVDGGSDALGVPFPQPEAATSVTSRRHRRHTERRPGDVTHRFC